MRRVAANANATPNTKPTTISTLTSPTTILATRRCPAPSAMRIPISFLRRATLYDMMP
jgi:hypothetical protein